MFFFSFFLHFPSFFFLRFFSFYLFLLAFLFILFSVFFCMRFFDFLFFLKVLYFRASRYGRSRHPPTNQSFRDCKVNLVASTGRNHNLVVILEKTFHDPISERKTNFFRNTCSNDSS